MQVFFSSWRVNKSVLDAMDNLVRCAGKTNEMNACMQPFLCKTWKVQTSCMEKCYKISMQHGKFLLMFYAACEVWKNPSHLLTNFIKNYIPKDFIHNFSSAQKYLLFVTSPWRVKTKNKLSAEFWRKFVVIVYM